MERRGQMMRVSKGHGKSGDGICTVRCCAPCCTIFSFIGVLFCALIAALYMYDSQPLVMDTSSPVAEVRGRRIPVLGAAGIYGATCALSAALWYWELRQRAWQRYIVSVLFCASCFPSTASRQRTARLTKSLESPQLANCVGVHYTSINIQMRSLH